MATLSAKYQYEHEVGERFDNRIRLATIYSSICVACAALVFGMIDGQHLVAAISHFLIALMAFSIAFFSREGFRTLILTSVYWTFSFMLYLYAISHFKLPTMGLYDPDRAALIALVSQLGLFLFSFIVVNRPIINERSYEKIESRSSLLYSIFLLFYAVGLLGVFGNISGILSSAISSFFILCVYISLGLRVLQSKQKFYQDFYFLFAFGLLALVSVSSNARTAIMGLSLFVLFLLIFNVERLLRWQFILLAYFGSQVLSAFSSTMLVVRKYRDTQTNLASAFLDRFFSIDTFWGILNPLHVTEVMRIHSQEALYYTGQFTTEFFQGSSGIMSRLTILPQMDIVTSRLPDINTIDWREIFVVFMSALPNFGQEKNLLLSDWIVWDLGLRDMETIGRPMITLQGELFALGGYWAVFIFTPILYACLYLGYRLCSNFLGSRVVGTLIFSQILINAFFSTTLLSVTTAAIRAPLQISALLILMLFVAASANKYRKTVPVTRNASKPIH